MSAPVRGKHTRDRSVLPPVDAELTRLSERWTYRALRSVAAAWVVAGLVGAYYDASSRHAYLTWNLMLAGRGGAGFWWDHQVPRGRLAVFALAVTGPAVVASLIGAARMFRAARTGRPHHGPSRWSVVGVVLAISLGPPTVAGFVLSDVYSPTSDAVLIAGFAPQVLAVLGGSLVIALVRTRYSPWTWTGRRRRAASTVRNERRPGARVLAVRLDEDASVLTATYADGSLYEYAGVSAEDHEAVSAALQADQGEFLRRIAGAKRFRRRGEPAWRPAPSTDEIGLPPVDWVAFAGDMLIGKKPRARGLRPRSARVRRAHRAAVDKVRVSAEGVTWRTLTGHPRHIAAARIAEVRLTEVEVGRAVVAYALALDIDGSALLRVEAGGGGAAGVDRKRRLSQMWAPLDIPVSRHSGVFCRPKDLRRSWPEAVSWVHAYPYVSVFGAMGLWLLVAVLVEHLTTS